MKRDPPISLVDALRVAIEKSGLTDYELAKRAEIAPIMIGRFMRGERDLKLATADKIARVLGCQLVR